MYSFWLIGLGDSSDGFKGLFQDIQPKDTKVILPNAPVRAVTINGGARMQAW
jgi:predicted esterase